MTQRLLQQGHELSHLRANGCRLPVSPRIRSRSQIGADNPVYRVLISIRPGFARDP